MIRNRCNILWVDEGIHTKNGGKTFATCASRMMQFSLRFWSGYLHQPKKYYNDSLSDLDLWPVTSKINRVHPLVIVNMTAKFDE